MIQPRNVIRRYTSIASAIDMLRRRQLTLLDPATWDDRNDRYFMDLYKEKKDLGGLYAACAASCFETYHHWRVFTASADGVCVEIKREPLQQALSQMSGIRFGKVNYLRLDQVEKLTEDDLENLPFFKRVAFEPEDEYRIVAESSSPQAPAMGIELSIAWITRIQINPWLPKRVAESVSTTLKSFDGCENLEVVRSHLIDSGRWKKAGDKVAGKKTRSTIAVRHIRKLRKKKK